MRRQIADTLANVSDTSNVELEHMCRALGVPFAQCWLPSSEDPNRLVAAGAPFFVNDRVRISHAPHTASLLGPITLPCLPVIRLPPELLPFQSRKTRGPSR
jgi:hypothetical protein